MNIHRPLQSTAGQAPATSASRTSSIDAENARLDAQLELAAKKAALAGMERAAAGQSGGDAAPAIAGADAPPHTPGGVQVFYEKDGKTIVLENPTREQLAQYGIASTPQLDAKMIVTLTGASLTAIVALTWMVLHYFRGNRSAKSLKGDPDMAARMARIENAIESVAVEVERISEGQRFTSRMLSEGSAQAVSVAPDHFATVMKNRGEM